MYELNTHLILSLSYNQGALSLFLYQCVCWTQLRFSVNFLQGNRNGFEGAGEGKDSWVVKSTLLGVAGCKMQMRHLNIERGKKKMIKDFSDVMMWGSGLRRLGGAYAHVFVLCVAGSGVEPEVEFSALRDFYLTIQTATPPSTEVTFVLFGSC